MEAVLRSINKSPYFKHLSMSVKEMGIGYSCVGLDIGNEHLNPFGGLHGGVHASVIDTAAYWAVYCELDEKSGLITIDLSVDYLAPTMDGKLIVKGRSIKIGSTMCLAEATVFNNNDKCLAHGISKTMVTKGLQSMSNIVDFLGGEGFPPKFSYLPWKLFHVSLSCNSGRLSNGHRRRCSVNKGCTSALLYSPG